eukprot:3252408-Pyramimonas_sp.AAC.1
MNAVWKDVFQHGLPYVLGGDFNMSPSVFFDGSPMGQVSAVIRAPEVPTYAVPQGSSTIDFFVLHRNLDHAVPWVRTDYSAPFSPHRPVQLHIQRAIQDIFVDVPKRYLKAPACPGIGPVPPGGDFTDLEDDLKAFLEPRLNDAGSTFMAVGNEKSRGVELLNRVYEAWIPRAWKEVVAATQ